MINLLVIEDDENQIQSINDAIEAFNLDSPEDIIAADYHRNDAGVYKDVFYKKYDCIVLDINWGRGKETAGRELAKKIIDSKRVPVFVYSGNLNEIEDIEERFGFRKFLRTTPFREIIDEAKKLKDSHIFDLLGYEGIIDQKILKVFWNDIDSARKFVAKIPEHDNSDALGRIITTRVVELLNIDVDSAKQKFYEFYIYPSLRKTPNNGDIYRLIVGDETNYYLIITPTCQLLNGTVPYANLLKIDFSNRKIDDVMNAAEQNRISKLTVLVTNPPAALHFIPPFSDEFDMGVINFNSIITRPVADLVEVNKVTTINPAYMKDVQARFSQYFSKQGQPAIDIEHLCGEIFRNR